MAELKTMRLNKVAKELNISIDRIADFLSGKGVEIEAKPNAKIDGGAYEMLLEEFNADLLEKHRSEQISQEKKDEKEALKEELAKKEQEEAPAPAKVEKEETPAPEVEAKEEDKEEFSAETESDDEAVVRAKTDAGSGIKTVGKIEIDEPAKPKKSAKSKVAEEAERIQRKQDEKKQRQKERKAEEKAAKAAEAEKAKKAKEAAAEKAEAEQVKAEEAAAAEPKEEKPADEEVVKAQATKLSGPKFTGEKIDLSAFEKPKKKKVASSSEPASGDKKRQRKRISKDQGPGGQKKDFKKGGNKGKKAPKVEPTEEEIQKQVRETLEKLTGGGKKSRGSKHRKARRDERREQDALDELQREEESKVLKVPEFVTVGELATMMDVSVNEVISTCMTLGMMVTMNQRLDSETLQVVVEEFGFQASFIGVEEDETEAIQEDAPEDLQSRSPIVTVMGHVDHGKTSLLDHIREANVIAGEAGGITQHIGAYEVTLKNGKNITFIDTPGHEAFTAMRARGAKVTDIAIIVIAADDDIMPQTKEAIAHAQAAGVPMVFAINKVDKDTANPDKIKEKLAALNLLVEEWGGKYQSHDVSAKTGLGVDDLLEKVLLEAELLELQANPDREASGSIIEASLDKGRGYVTTCLVQNGTLNIGDYVLAGSYSGKVKAMFDERGNQVKKAGPSRPVSLLGLDGAPQAGDTFRVFEDEREAKNIAGKRKQLQREHSVRTQKQLTLDEIGRRLAIGDFQELNIILKGDMDGSIEALSDSLQKLSTEEIQVNIIHKAVGQISESDVLLASASGAIIVGFQVRPSAGARRLAEQEEVDIRTYSIIYAAIEEVRSAMEGMLSPDIKEEVVCNIEIRETFKISKVGTIAGCMVLDGKVNRNTKVRVIRDGVVIHTGELGSLKRFKDDVKEVAKGYECGLNIANFNDIQVGDIIEGYEEVEVKKTL